MRKTASYKAKRIAVAIALTFLVVFAMVLAINPTISDIAFASSMYKADKYVHIGGKPIGIVVSANGLIVIGSADVVTEEGNVSPLSDVDVKRGDVIIAVNDKVVDGLYLFRKAVSSSKGEITLKIKRGGETIMRSVKPVMDMLSRERRIGLVAKEDIGGVGTLTFVTNNGQFAGLGHRIFDAESGLSDELQSGKIFNVEVEGVVKGEKGKAGGLQASINRLQPSIGDIKGNTAIGLYGKIDDIPQTDLYRIAEFGEAKMGKAQVFTTIKGSEPKFYDIDIVKVVSQNEVGEKGMVIAVRDRELLDKAGGIVQGMSGSPIIQNGLLIGAVTHVFIADPTRGYAVHSRFMLNRAEQVFLPSIYEIAA